MRSSQLDCLCFAFALYCGSVQGDVVTDWNGLMLAAIRNESTPPPLAARNLAILHASIYDAVNSIGRLYQPYYVSLSAPTGTSTEAAAVGAAHECLAYLYPSQAAAFDKALDQYLDGTQDTESRSNGLSIGAEMALIILSWREADGSSTTIPYIPGYEPGDWQRTPPFYHPPDLPQWADVEPFAMTNGSQFRPPGPPALTSLQYTADFNQVKALGGLNSTNRTADQTQIARFWSDFSNTVTPAGHWNAIAQNIATNTGLSLVQNARLFALLNIAMADASIAAWDAKYYYDFWRPVTAIREADTDGNPDTISDPNWLPLLVTPSFPEYVSGHSTFSGAAAKVLATFMGSDTVPFAVGSDALPGVTRSFSSLSGAAEEVGMSRIYGGFHYLTSDLDGLTTGRAIAGYVMQGFLLPVPVPTRVIMLARLSDGRVQCQIAATADQALILQSSTNLVTWQNLSTNVAIDGTINFVDATAAGLPSRFYRARVAP